MIRGSVQFCFVLLFCVVLCCVVLLLFCVVVVGVESKWLQCYNHTRRNGLVDQNYSTPVQVPGTTYYVLRTTYYVQVVRVSSAQREQSF